MDFELSDEQAMLRDASRDLLADRGGIDVVRAQLDTDLDVDQAFWRLASDLGWTGLALPEEYGGSGQGLVDLAIVAEQIGWALARGPFLTSALVGRAIARLADPVLAAELLPALAAGDVWATWAFAEPSSPWTLDGVRTTARTDSGTIVLDGRKTAVPEAHGARWLLVTARHDGAPASFVVDRHAAGVSVRRQRTFDLTRSFYELGLDGVRVPPSHRLAGGSNEVQRLLDDAVVLRCADALGLMERMLRLTTEYLKVRVQFDRPIGSFQAVKHKCADMAMRCHASRAATYYAASSANAAVSAADTSDAEVAACVAASYVSASVGEVAGSALQLHGGIGFTWEHDLHLYLRRAKADGLLYGDAPIHRERLCQLLSTSRGAA